MRIRQQSHRIGGNTKSRQRGTALAEFGFVAPLLMLLLLAVVDSGLYTTAFIASQNAARAAALRNSGGTESSTDQAAACEIALSELRGLPGVPATGNCGSAPLTVTSVLCAAGTSCGSSESTADGRAAVLVSVRYTIPGVFRLPLVGPPQVAAKSQMRVRSYE
ncbi:MAG: TadE/TadG family type IV pilus assembly protein [Bryobacteraceae bacterium]